MRIRSNIKTNLQSLCVISALIAVLCLLSMGCASYRFTGYRTIERPPQRVGPVSDSLIGYSSLEGKHFPTQASPYLEVLLKKKLAANVRYDSKAYQQKIFKKQRSKIEANMLPITCIAGLFLLFGKSYSGYALPAVGLMLLTTPSPPPEYNYTRVPSSDDVIMSYRKEVLTVPAAGESLIAVEIDTVETDDNGVARFDVKPWQCDNGITIMHSTTGVSYLVRRILKDRTVTADWVKTAILLRNIVGSAVTVAQLVNMATAGAGTEAMVLTVVVDAVTGVAIDFVIRKLGTSTEQYYDWLIVVRR